MQHRYVVDRVNARWKRGSAPPSMPSGMSATEHACFAEVKVQLEAGVGIEPASTALQAAGVLIKSSFTSVNHPCNNSGARLAEFEWASNGKLRPETLIA